MASVRSIRVYWNDVASGWYNFNWNGVTFGRSVVHISICEASRPVPDVPFAGNVDRIRGDAQIYVKNVHPHFPNRDDPQSSGGVEFYIVNEWHTPLPVAVDITVCDFPESEEYVGFGRVYR